MDAPDDFAASGHPPDGELLRRFYAGDELALAALVARHAPMMGAVARRRLDQSADAEDIAQTVLAALIRQGRTLTANATVGGWLHTATVRAAVRQNLRRRREADARRRLGELRPTAADFDAIARQATLATLDQELAELPDAWREPLVLRYLSGLSNVETAERMGLSLSAVEGRLKRAKAALKSRLLRRGVSLAVLAIAARATAAQAAPTIPNDAIRAAPIDPGLSDTLPPLPRTETAMSSWMTTLKATACGLLLLLLPGAGVADDGPPQSANAAPPAAVPIDTTIPSDPPLPTPTVTAAPEPAAGDAADASEEPSGTFPPPTLDGFPLLTLEQKPPLDTVLKRSLWLQVYELPRAQREYGADSPHTKRIADQIEELRPAATAVRDNLTMEGLSELRRWAERAADSGSPAVAAHLQKVVLLTTMPRLSEVTGRFAIDRMSDAVPLTDQLNQIGLHVESMEAMQEATRLYLLDMEANAERYAAEATQHDELAESIGPLEPADLVTLVRRERRRVELIMASGSSEQTTPSDDRISSPRDDDADASERSQPPAGPASGATSTDPYDRLPPIEVSVFGSADLVPDGTVTVAAPELRLQGEQGQWVIAPGPDGSVEGRFEPATDDAAKPAAEPEQTAAPDTAPDTAPETTATFESLPAADRDLLDRLQDHVAAVAALRVVQDQQRGLRWRPVRINGTEFGPDDGIEARLREAIAEPTAQVREAVASRLPVDRRVLIDALEQQFYDAFATEAVTLSARELLPATALSQLDDVPEDVSDLIVEAAPLAARRSAGEMGMGQTFDLIVQAMAETVEPADSDMPNAVPVTPDEAEDEAAAPSDSSAKYVPAKTSGSVGHVSQSPVDAIKASASVLLLRGETGDWLLNVAESGRYPHDVLARYLPHDDPGSIDPPLTSPRPNLDAARSQWESGTVQEATLTPKATLLVSGSTVRLVGEDGTWVVRTLGPLTDDFPQDLLAAFEPR